MKQRGVINRKTESKIRLAAFYYHVHMRECNNDEVAWERTKKDMERTADHAAELGVPAADSQGIRFAKTRPKRRPFGVLDHGFDE